MGIEIIRYLQTFKLDSVMEFFTALGGVYCIVLGIVAATIFWPSRGALLGATLFFALLTNNILKSLFVLPRPFVIYPDVLKFVEPGYSFPSGHSTCGAAFWIGASLLLTTKKRMLIPAILITFGIGVSRCYFGIHYPTDVLAGWALGAAIVWPAYLIERSRLR